ncbi:hypothetical protein, partial [Mycolicibacterium thermoresistibile]|uniref:hypothetical protein n=1 Tax=Mycolicibacterium thermoresistibile TaxID=1797 RepID=UPI001A94539A
PGAPSGMPMGEPVMSPAGLDRLRDSRKRARQPVRVLRRVRVHHQVGCRRQEAVLPRAVSPAICRS